MMEKHVVAGEDPLEVAEVVDDEEVAGAHGDEEAVGPGQGTVVVDDVGGPNHGGGEVEAMGWKSDGIEIAWDPRPERGLLEAGVGPGDVGRGSPGDGVEGCGVRRQRRGQPGPGRGSGVVGRPGQRRREARWLRTFMPRRVGRRTQQGLDVLTEDEADELLMTFGLLLIIVVSGHDDGVCAVM